MSTFNITKLYERAFGNTPIVQEPYKISNKPIVPQQGIRGAAFFADDITGTEHFMPVILDDLVIPYAIIEISAKKIIQSTPLAERKGAVYEIVSTEDYAINIKGILIEPDRFPEQQMIMWHSVFEKDQSVSLRCAKTDIFLKGDDKVIIKDMRWPPLPGVEHVQPVEFQLITDFVYTLEINQ